MGKKNLKINSKALSNVKNSVLVTGLTASLFGWVAYKMPSEIKAVGITAACVLTALGLATTAYYFVKYKKEKSGTKTYSKNANKVVG